MPEPITAREFHDTEGLEEWRVLAEGAFTYFATGSLADGARLVQAIAGLPGLALRQPDLDVRFDGVTVRLITTGGTYWGLSTRDVELARAISGVAHDLGFRGDPSRVQSMLIVPGAPVPAEVVPFWQAVLGYERRSDSPEEDLVDPASRLTSFWFEQMDEPRGDGGGAIHVGVFVAPEQAEARVAAALAAGGRMVRDEFAPAWWTLADAAGNEADIATMTGRD